MDKEKMKLAMKLAQENPNLDIDALIRLIDTEKQETADDNHRIETPVKIKNDPGHYRKPWSSNDVNTLIILHNQGASNKEIGKELGRTRQSVSSKILLLREEGRLAPSVGGKRRPYTNQELETLKSILLSHDNEPRLVPRSVLIKTAADLHRTESAIQTTLYNIRSRGGL